MKAHPLTVVAIRPGSSADRDGQLKVGDRVLQVNGYKVTHLTLSEMWSLLNQCGHQTTFTIAYDIAVMDAVENASGPLLVEIDKTPGSVLGIVLAHSSYQGKACVCVESIRPMSVADRSGALHVGDHILAIDGASVEHMSVAEASQLLKAGSDNCVKLEILPVTHLQHCMSREALRKSLVPSVSSVTLPSMSPTASIHNGIATLPSIGSQAASTSGVAHFATLGSRGSRGSGHISRWMWPGMERKVNSCMSMVSATTSVRTANNQVCHMETVEVMLFGDAKGLGITLEGGVFSTAVLSHPPVIAAVEPRSAAEKSGVIQEGDRIISVNGMETTERTLEEVNQFLRESRPRCVLEVEFDVAESVTPSCGTYTVKLAKKTGGDKLLAVNDVRLDTCTVEDAAHLLELPDDIVKLKLQRDDPEAGSEGCVTYTVQLERQGGPLGITISGTEDPLDHIIISELTPGGLAQKTAAMHVGDRLLAINGNTTKNKPLSEAIRMLQSAGDIVTLKIARPYAPDKSKLSELEDSSKPSTPIPSIDSAMESWDSSGQECGMMTSSHSQAMVVAMPQLNRLSTASSTQLPSRNSMAVEGSGEGMADVQLCDNDWGDIGNDDDDDDDSSRHSEASSVEVEDWARTLGDLEENSGSEMLRQISMSLRQRSTFSLDRRSNASDSKQHKQRQAERRSNTAPHVNRASKSQDGLHR
nr:hypothetical protein BaRGS_026221 [Batillaria attramentaria]